MIKVLVTGIGGGGIGEQILKALNLSNLELFIYGSDVTELSKNKDSVEEFLLLKPASSEDYISDLLNICLLNKIEIVFPGSEPELKKISTHRDLFKKHNIFLPINPEHVINLFFDKKRTNEFLEENKFPFPKSLLINNIADIDKVDFFPVVLKPNIGGSGSANIMIAQTKAELAVFGRYLLDIYSDFLAQEYIGTPENEFTVGVLFDMKGNYINTIALNRIITNGLGCKINIKNKTSNSELGDRLVISSGISQGTLDKFPHITEACVEIAKKIGATGTINIQCRFFKNKIFVFEINPRFSGTTSLRAMVGYNEPEILIKELILKESTKVDFYYDNVCILRGLDEKSILRQ